MKFAAKARAFAALLAFALMAPLAQARELPRPETFTLRNGLQVVVITDRRAPVVTHMIWYRVGAADEPRGHSGIAHFFEVGRGICHQVFSEEALLEPGQLILGSDSHTPHFGWMGAFGAGVGRSEMAVIWATGELWLRVPESLRIELHGAPPPWVSAKDAALHVIGALGEDGGLYNSVEIVGEAVAAFSLESRMALASNPESEPARESLFEALRRKVGVLQATVSLMNQMRQGNPAGAADAAAGLGRKSS